MVSPVYKDYTRLALPLHVNQHSSSVRMYLSLSYLLALLGSFLVREAVAVVVYSTNRSPMKPSALEFVRIEEGLLCH